MWRWPVALTAIAVFLDVGISTWHPHMCDIDSPRSKCIRWDVMCIYTNELISICAYVRSPCIHLARDRLGDNTWRQNISNNSCIRYVSCHIRAVAWTLKSQRRSTALAIHACSSQLQQGMSLYLSATECKFTSTSEINLHSHLHIW